MANRSRVEKYAELRKHIDNMDVFTFDDPDLATKPEPVTTPEPLKDEPMSMEEVQQAHIKKNTLSLSIDELIKQHEEYTKTIAVKDIDEQNKEYDAKKKNDRQENLKSNLAWLLWIVLGCVIVAVAIIIGLVIGGVI